MDLFALANAAKDAGPMIQKLPAFLDRLKELAEAMNARTILTQEDVRELRAQMQKVFILATKINATVNPGEIPEAIVAEVIARDASADERNARYSPTPMHAEPVYREAGEDRDGRQLYEQVSDGLTMGMGGPKGW